MSEKKEVFTTIEVDGGITWQEQMKRKIKKSRKESNAKKPHDRYPFRMSAEDKSKLNTAAAWPKHMSKMQRYRIIEKAKRSRLLGMREAAAPVWGPMKGIGNPKFSFYMSRHEIMAYIVDMISNTGISLPKLVEMHGEDEEMEFPTLQEIRVWCKLHPDFERELYEADRNRGEILGEQALDAVMSAPKDEDPRITKLRHEALSRHAARLNERYQDKQVQKIEDVTDKMSREEMLKQLQGLANKHKEIADVVLPVLGDGIENDAADNLGEGCIVDVVPEVREEGNCCICEKPRRECIC